MVVILSCDWLMVVILSCDWLMVAILSCDWCRRPQVRGDSSEQESGSEDGETLHQPPPAGVDTFSWPTHHDEENRQVNLRWLGFHKPLFHFILKNSQNNNCCFTQKIDKIFCLQLLGTEEESSDRGTSEDEGEGEAR